MVRLMKVYLISSFINLQALHEIIACKISYNLNKNYICSVTWKDYSDNLFCGNIYLEVKHFCDIILGVQKSPFVSNSGIIATKCPCQLYILMCIKYGVGCCLLSELWAWGRHVRQVIAAVPRLFCVLKLLLSVISAFILIFSN